MTCPSCGAFVRHDWKESCGSCQQPLVAPPPPPPPPAQPSEQWGQPQQQWATQPGQHWTPQGGPAYAMQPSGGNRGLIITAIVIGSFVAVLLLAIVAIGAIGFLGGAADDKSVARADPEVVPPQPNWVSFEEPTGSFHANFPTAPTPQTIDDSGNGSSYMSIQGGLVVGVTYESRDGAIASVDRASAVKGLKSTASNVISDKTGSIHGASYEDVVIQSDGGAYSEARVEVSSDTIYILSVTAKSQEALATPFADLTDGFRVGPGDDSLA